MLMNVPGSILLLRDHKVALDVDTPSVETVVLIKRKAKHGSLL